jgi:hypothetical protein
VKSIAASFLVSYAPLSDHSLAYKSGTPTCCTTSSRGHYVMHRVRWWPNHIPTPGIASHEQVARLVVHLVVQLFTQWFLTLTVGCCYGCWRYCAVENEELTCQSRTYMCNKTEIKLKLETVVLKSATKLKQNVKLFQICFRLIIIFSSTVWKYFVLCFSQSARK